MLLSCRRCSWLAGETEMAKGIDCDSSVFDSCGDLKAAGIEFVCRYLPRSGKIDPLSLPEASHIAAMGMYNVSIWESGNPTHDSYFTDLCAQLDSEAALLACGEVRQPVGTPVYFCVDYDADPAVVLPYFKILHESAFHESYAVAAYGSGRVLQALGLAGYVSHVWLSQSTGFPGYKEMAGRADIIQGPGTTMFGLDVDLDESNGSAGGWVPTRSLGPATPGME